MKKKKDNRIGEYKEACQGSEKIIDIVKLGSSFKNQPGDNKGRYIHIGATSNHVDDYEKRNKKGEHLHMDIAELKTVSLRNLPKTVLVPWNYSNFCVGVPDITVPDIKIEKHRGSLTIRGSPQSGEILLGSVDPSHTWWRKR